ncbi:MAG: hypothetical protein A3B68_07920 [Candidatus Melainabacteria bacterium RIFCSPHIGHO2_02_FULL_34_12]|nr:MAG: hypothetical protein A3B68_07920 [Candidatus Melainabacteria bacterium RIFCSPHIGHO2_02_FULL_34_12]
MLPSVLVGFYSNPEHISPLTDSIDLLSNEFRVIVVARDVGNFNYKYPSNVSLFKIGPHCEMSKYNMPFYKKLFSFLSFILKLFILIRREKPSILFLYDTNAYIAGWLASRPFRNIPIFYHQSDPVLLSEIPKNYFSYFAKCLELNVVRSADVLSFTDPYNAKLFLDDAKLKIKKEVIIVENCTCKLINIPKMSYEMQKIKDSGKQIIIHRGPVGSGVNLRPAVRSIKYWPDNSVLVLLGLIANRQIELCRNVVQQEGFLDRVILVPYLPTREELLGYTVSADIGLILYKIKKEGMKYWGPTKLYDYIACGIPVIAPKEMIFVDEIIKRHEIGLTFESDSPEVIGKTIRHLLEQPALLQKMRDNARKIHLSELNYETQFEPLLKKIKNVIGDCS